MLLLARACVPGMSLRGRSRGPGVRSFCFGSPLDFRFRSGVLLARRGCNRCSRLSMCFGGASGRLLFFFLLLRLFLDSAQLAKDFLAILASLSPASELHGKDSRGSREN